MTTARELTFRAGQYFHYLTQWMHALAQLSRATGDSMYTRYAVELAQTAVSSFAHDDRLYWKMSIDLSRPLIRSMCAHDALGGLAVCAELQRDLEENVVIAEISQLNRMARTQGVSPTDDALGIGGLLCDALWLLRGGAQYDDVIRDTISAAAQSLEMFDANAEFSLRARYRLAFRELGMAIGLRGVERLAEMLNDRQELLDGTDLERLSQARSLSDRVVASWMDESHRLEKSWTEHADINTVMLATALLPDGFLGL